MYIRTYSINYSTTLIIIIVIIIHTIQYIYYNYRHTKYDICLHYTVSCEEAMLYTNSCIYYTMLYYVYIYALSYYDIWPWIITSYTILIYYNNYYYDNCNSYLFLFLSCCCMCVYVCVYVLCCVVSLLCVYVCSLMCPRICSYMCICVCLPRITLPDRAVVKRLMCWYRGGYISGKNFYKIWKMGIPGKNRPQEHFWFGKTVKTLDKTVQMCYNINIETKGDWYYDETRLLNHFSRRKTRFSR